MDGKIIVMWGHSLIELSKWIKRPLFPPREGQSENDWLKSLFSIVGKKKLNEYKIHHKHHSINS